MPFLNEYLRGASEDVLHTTHVLDFTSILQNKTKQKTKQKNLSERKNKTKQNKNNIHVIRE